MHKKEDLAKMANWLFEAYKNSVILHGCHMYSSAYDMAMAKLCEYTPSQHAITHWKCVVFFF